MQYPPKHLKPEPLQMKKHLKLSKLKLKKQPLKQKTSKLISKRHWLKLET